ncbi:MAG: GGDEF domain-containing protein [Cellvibrionaceae bacterium]
MRSLRSVNSSNELLNTLKRIPSDISIDDSIEDRYALTNALQSSLDLNEQMKVFFNWVSERIYIDGLSYSHKAQGVNISLGEKEKHECEYRLTTQTDNLGELVFTRRRRFSENNLFAIETMITSLLFPIRNALKYRQALLAALKDPLTGTGNRLALDNALHRELLLSHRYNQELSLLMIDVDHFKLVNDTYGHNAGDTVLKKVADIIVDIARQTDMTFRYGGEEFIVVLSKTNIDGAKIIADRIRKELENTKITVGNGDINVTISLGVTNLKKSENVDELFTRADSALYQAKNAGRNKVVCLPA